MLNSLAFSDPPEPPDLPPLVSQSRFSFFSHETRSLMPRVGGPLARPRPGCSTRDCTTLASPRSEALSGSPDASPTRSDTVRVNPRSVKPGAYSSLAPKPARALKADQLGRCATVSSATSATCPCSSSRATRPSPRFRSSTRSAAKESRWSSGSKASNGWAPRQGTAEECRTYASHWDIERNSCRAEENSMKSVNCTDCPP